MTVSVLRTAEGWWVRRGSDAARIETTAGTTGELLRDRTAIQAAQQSSATVPVDTLALLSPVTRPCRVVAPIRVKGGRSIRTERADGPSPMMRSSARSSIAG